MGALEEIKSMQKQGLSEKQIIENLQEKGFSYKEISEGLAQNKIKSAIEEPLIDSRQPELPPLESPKEEELLQAPQESNIYQKDNFEPSVPSPGPAGMQKSLMVQSPEASNQQVQEYFPAQPQDYGYDQNAYPQYDYTSPALSADTITEISEQVVSERLSDVRKKMEKMIDFKTALEAKAESIEERLKRIEKIIDTLQSSVLRKVGDYVTNVEDLKKELVATQQSFTSVAQASKKQKRHKKQTHSPPHPQHQAHQQGQHHAGHHEHRG